MRREAAECVCVTLCSKEFLFGSCRRGPAADKQTLANKAMLARWMRSETSDRVPAKKLLLTLPTPLFVFMVLARYTPKPFAHRRLAADLPPRCVYRSGLSPPANNVQQYFSADSATFPFSHSFPRGIDATANPLSKCVCCVSRPVTKGFSQASLLLSPSLSHSLSLSPCFP